MAFSSIFDQQFDVAIYGAGYAGIAAALQLQKAGLKVLLLDRRLDIAWESGRSFVPHAGDYQHELWDNFLQELQTRNLSDGNLIDGAGAEITLAARLRELRPDIQVLLGAFPVEIALRGKALQRLTIATKNGLHAINAARWIDASDDATLLRLMAPKSTFSAPNYYQYRAILSQQNTENFSDAEYGKISDCAFLERRLWQFEMTLGINSPRKLRLAELLKCVEEQRAQLPETLRDATIVAFSGASLPIYADEAPVQLPDYSNFAAISWKSDGEFLGNRFGWGIEAAQKILRLPAVDNSDDGAITRRALPTRQESCDIFVAGAGTAGALAAISASRAGNGELKVLCCDVAPFAGGVGSGGLINGYFHGESGGLFEQFDEKAQQIGAIIDSKKAKRGHETKKIAFEENFLQNGTNKFITEALPFAVKVQNRRVRSVKLATPDGIIEIATKAAIDATGDGDLALLAGAKFTMGRAGDGFTLSYSQPSLVSMKSGEKRIIRTSSFDAGWANPDDPEDFTRARLASIAQYQTCPISDDFHLIFLAPILGIRQSRHIETEETLTLSDLLNHRSSDSSIGKARSPLDTHSIDYEFEDDETLFWLWGCKSFRESTFADMPYGITVAKNFENLWIAARSAGIAPAAAYAARMQRDMQRIGEAVGYSAVIAVQQNVAAQNIDIARLQEKLHETGALKKVLLEEEAAPSKEDILAQLDEGVAGAYLWQIYQQKASFEAEILQRLCADDENISWLAAVILAMWNDVRAESRLLAAIDNREQGTETPAAARGPYSQWIDVPNWFLAINLLRRCGSAKCLPALQKIAEQPDNILNLRTSIALMIARLADKFSAREKQTAAAILKVLLRGEVPHTYVRPSRSIWRQLRGEPQKPLPQEAKGVDTREDHRWRLDFAVAKAARKLGADIPESAECWRNDERSLVRRAFREFV